MVLQGFGTSNMADHRSAPGLDDASSVGKRLRALRKQRRLTQSELARQIGIQQSDLSRMEKGEYRVSLDNLLKILGVFGVQIAEFFGEQSPERNAPQQPLSQSDMRVLHLLRRLSPEGREEVRQFLEFKLRREQSGARLDDSRQQRGEGK